MSVRTTVAPDDPPQVPERTCFVIGPIGDRHAADGSPEQKAYEESLQIFEKVILPACAKFGIAPVRADRISSAGELTEQICRHVLQSDFVIADVSGGNANVMYELGLRHLVGKPAIHIGEHGQLPFDISLIRTIRFIRSLSGFVDARTELENALTGAINEEFELLTPARILRGLRVPASASNLAGDEEETDEDAPGLIDRFAQVEEQMEEMTATVDAMTAALGTIAELTDEASPAMERASQPGSPMSARVPVMAQYAVSIGEPSSDLKKCTTRFAGQMAELDAAMQAALDFIEQIPPEERGTSEKELLAQLIGMSEATHEAMQGISLFETALKWMVSLSREMRKPGKDISSAVRQVRAVMGRIGEWERRARELI
ncbi:hypothetical protein [Streptomyces alboflavus]|uniref:hypothetical protein n=1 Tax=Streptomyces alboflavus TaxID=67267 RepID=UPI0036C0AB0C